jgi:hypothetical protein
MPKKAEKKSAFLEKTYARWVAAYLTEIHDHYQGVLKKEKEDETKEETLRETLQAILKVKDISQAEIATALAEHPIQIGRWQRGDHIPPKPGYRRYLVEKLLAFVKGVIAERERLAKAA